MLNMTSLTNSAKILVFPRDQCTRSLIYLTYFITPVPSHMSNEVTQRTCMHLESLITQIAFRRS